MLSNSPDVAVSDALLGQVVALLRTLVYAPHSSVTAETMLVDLGMDSLDLVEVGLELEAAIGCDLPDGALAHALTVGDLARCFASGAPGQVVALAN
jgi:acyl carrier protein